MGLFGSKTPTLRENVEETCHKFDLWSYMVASIRHKQDWRTVVNVMFEDGIYHEGRLAVLDVFTSDAVQKLDREGKCIQAEMIRNAYSEWMLKLPGHRIFDNTDGALRYLMGEIERLKEENNLLKTKGELTGSK